jgi:hypothetical protein
MRVVVKQALFVFLALSALAAINVFAKEPTSEIPALSVLFGPEFTFSGPEDECIALGCISKRQVAHLVDGQPPGAKFFYEDRANRFTSPNGWSFTTSRDPGVVEVQMSPLPLQEWERYQHDMQDAIFVSAANEGWFPALFRGGGHINIGIAELRDASPLLLRNFLADLFNHSELFMGIFNYDTNNALPYPLYATEARENIQRAFRRFDAGYISLADLLNTVDAEQCAQSDDLGTYVWSLSTRNKYTAVSLINVTKVAGGRLELRGVRPQASMDVWVRQIRLIYKRLVYLSRINRPIPIQPIVPLAEPIVRRMDGHGLNPPVDPQKALAAFHQYVMEAGEHWQDHKDYLWPEWLTDGEVRRYERSQDFKRLQRQSCAQALELAPAI